MKLQAIFVSSLALSAALLITSCVHKEVDTNREPAGSRSAGTNRTPPNLPANQTELAATCSANLEKSPKEVFLRYKAYWASYNPLYRIPNWIQHEVYRDALERSCVKRNDKFRSDERLRTDFNLEPVENTAYKNSGYDRGHMAPSGDFQWSKEVNAESFFMTNMGPQTPNLNQNSWNSLEGRVRRWACGNGHIKIYTGPVMKPNMPRLNSCVGVPDEFFKVILADTAGNYKAIGFIYNQNDVNDVWKERALTVAEVETRTGLNFFTEFPDDIAKKFKNNIDLDAWEKSEINCRACEGVVKQIEN